MNLERWQAIKDKVERLQKKREQTKGALEQLNKRLAEEFECKSLEEAKALLKELKQEKADGEKAFEEALKKFEKEWGSTINEQAD